MRNANDKPEYGKQYALTGATGTKCIANGNSWEESEVPISDVAKEIIRPEWDKMQETIAEIGERITDGGGLDSLMNETKLSFKRGQTIKFLDKDGVEHRGKYVMASSYADHIVVNMGGRNGRPAVVPISKITN